MAKKHRGVAAQDPPISGIRPGSSLPACRRQGELPNAPAHVLRWRQLLDESVALARGARQAAGTFLAPQDPDAIALGEAEVARLAATLVSPRAGGPLVALLRQLAAQVVDEAPARHGRAKR